MHRLIALLALCTAVACGPDAVDTDVDLDTSTDTDVDTDTDSGSDTDTDTDSDTDTDADTDSDTAPRSVVEDVIAALSGGTPVDQVLAEHDASDAWPVQDDDGDWLFVVDARAFPDPSIAGSMTDWEPRAMEAAGDARWLRIPASEGDTYKIVTEGRFFADPWSRAYAYDDNGRISLVGRPSDRWRLERWWVDAADPLGDRTARVLVPPGAGPWPVLYAQDGQNLFDPGAIGGGWRLDRAVQDLDTDVLVVGIDNSGGDRLSDYAPSDDRLRDLDVTGNGDAYADLVHDTVRPHVERTYGSTGVDGLLGSSMGGLISLHIASREPARWDFVASMSGTLGWGAFAGSGPTIQDRYEGMSAGPYVVFVDSGGGPGADGCQDLDEDGYVEDDPDDADNYCTTRAFADALAAHGYTWGETLHHWYEPGAAHNEAAWAARVFRPLGVFEDLSR